MNNTSPVPSYPTDAPARRGLVVTVLHEDGTPIDCTHPTPIDPSDIVLPPGWLLDADGRGYSVLEMQQHTPR